MALLLKCKIWEKGKDKDGYGRLRTGGKEYRAHRYFYEKEKGLIPKGMQIDHLCRNPSCIEVSHLEVVTQAENLRRGNSAKLNKGQVKIIRILYKTREYKQWYLGKLFNVGQDQISRIINFKRWVDV